MKEKMMLMLFLHRDSSVHHHRGDHKTEEDMNMVPGWCICKNDNIKIDNNYNRDMLLCLHFRQSVPESYYDH